MKIKMTDQALAKQKPKDDRYEVWDTLVSNLMVTVFPSGKKTWSVRYRSDGKRVKMKLGDYPNLALSDARRKAKDVLVSVADGENPAYEKRKDVKSKSRTRQTLQISNLLELYEKLHLSQLRTGYQAKTFLREFARDFGHLSITDFTKQDFVGLLNEIMLAGNHTKANRVYAHIKSFYSWAIGQGYLDRSPCEYIKRPYKEQSRKRFLSDQEIYWFWQVTGEELEPFGNMARLLLLTGQRLSEVCRMTENELQGRDHWHLSAERTKNKEQHDVFLSDLAQQIVWRDNRVAGVYLFSTTGYSAVQSYDKPVKRFRSRMNELAGEELPHWSFHDLRRTCETGMAMLGIDQNTIDRCTNHLSGRFMSRVYNQYEYQSQKTEAWQRWADHVKGLVDG
jgi:integrase